MSPHKKIYFDHFGLSEGDWIACAICGKSAVDIHAVECDGMGGSPSKSTHVITNLIPLCREDHNKYGDKKQYKEWLKELAMRNLSRLI